MTSPKRKHPEPFDGVTLDHLRVLVAVADAGSFSAAARRIGRVQSAVSQAMASLEDYVGVKIWDRASLAVTLTDRGRRVLGDARRVLAEMDRMRDAVKTLRGGKREKLSMCIDALTRLDVEAWSEDEHRLPLGLVFPPGLRSRPIVRWLATNLPALCLSWGVGLPISRGDG